MQRCSTDAGSEWGSHGVRGAADFGGSCGRCACGTLTAQQSGVEDHALGAAGEETYLFVGEGHGRAHSEDRKDAEKRNC